MQGAASVVESSANSMKSSMNAANNAIATGAARVAQQLKAEGVSAEGVASALKNMGYSAAQVEAATAGMTSAVAEAGAATEAAGTQARKAAADFGYFRAGVVATGSGLRVVAREMSSGFNLVTIAAIGYVAVEVGEKIYDLYENVILLKHALEELSVDDQKLGYAAGEAAYHLAEENAELAKAQGHVALAKELFEKAAAIKPIHLGIAIGKDELSKLPKQLQQLVGDSENFYNSTTSKQYDWNAAIKAGQDALATLNGELAVSQTVNRGGFDSGLNQILSGPVVSKNLSAQIEAVKKYLEIVQSARNAAQANAQADEIQGQIQSLRTHEKGAETMVEKYRAAWQKMVDAEQAGHELTALDEEEYWTHVLSTVKGATAKELDEMRAYQSRAHAEVQRGTRENLVAAAEGSYREIEMVRSHTEEIERLNDEFHRRIEEQDTRAQLKERADWQRYYQERVAGAKQHSDEELRIAAESSKPSGAGGALGGIQTWAQKQMEALNAWYAQSKSILLAAEKEAENTFGAESAEYQRLKNEEMRLDDEYAAHAKKIAQDVAEANQRAVRSMADETAKFVTAAISGGRKMHEEFARRFNEMADNFIRNMIRMLAQQAAGAILHKSMAKDEQLADAKAAAAGAWKALAGIPIIGPELGAIAAATVFAGAMAFERGGIIPETGSFYGHRGEAVLPQPLTTMLMHAANSVTTNDNSSRASLNVSAVDGQSVARLFANHSGELARQMQRMARKNYS